MATTIDPTRPTTAGVNNINTYNGDTSSTPKNGGASRTPPGIKAPPVCVDESLKESAMTTESLSELVFSPEALVKTSKTASIDVISHPLTTAAAAAAASSSEAIPVSSCSSTCTRESDVSGTFSDAEGHHHHHHHPNNNNNNNHNNVINNTRSAAAAAATPQVKFDRGVSGRLNAKVSLRKTSRQGRSTQRWLTGGANANETIRLVTGCVPILKGGKILFVSSSRKSEWILPKGGWEKDEALEESAVRECFEEAGVLGTLGPQLKGVQYETRKAKKRRLEQEEIIRQKKKLNSEASETDKDEEDSDNSNNKAAAAAVATTDTTTAPSRSSAPQAVATSGTTVASPISNEDISRIRGQAQENALKHSKSSDETLSVASNLSAAYSQVRMTLFPLYVTEIHDNWPESGRFRKAVDIDEAIRLMGSRPEFKAALEEVKERNLHVVNPGTSS